MRPGTQCQQAGWLSTFGCSPDGQLEACSLRVGTRVEAHQHLVTGSSQHAGISRATPPGEQRLNLGRAYQKQKWSCYNTASRKWSHCCIGPRLGVVCVCLVAICDVTLWKFTFLPPYLASLKRCWKKLFVSVCLNVIFESINVYVSVQAVVASQYCDSGVPWYVCSIVTVQYPVVYSIVTVEGLVVYRIVTVEESVYSIVQTVVAPQYCDSGVPCTVYSVVTVECLVVYNIVTVE